MKKVPIRLTAAILALSIFGTPACLAGAARDMAQAAEVVDVQKLSQEANRNREMIEIWKEHVRTLTEERDEAYKKIEEIKTQGTSVETSETPEASVDTAALTRDKEAALARIRELQAKIASLESQRRPDTAEKEIEELRADKNVLVTDKERALARVQGLEEKLQKAQTESASARREAAQEKGLDASSNVSLKKDIQETVAKDFHDRIVSLEAENASLRASANGITKAQNLLSDTEAKNVSLASEIARLKTEIESLKKDDEEAVQQGIRLHELQEKYEALEATRSPQEPSLDRNETLRARSEKLDAVEAELKEARAYFTALVEKEQASVKRLNSEKEALRSELEDARAAQADTESARVIKLMKDLEKTREERDVLRAARGDAEAGTKAAEERARAAAVAAKARDAKLADFEKELTAARAAALEASRRNEEAESSLRALTARNEMLTAETEKLKGLETGLRDVQTGSESLKAANARLEEEVSALRTSHTAAEKEIADLKASAERLTAERDALSQVEKDLSQTRASRDALEKERADTFLQLQSLRTQLAKAQSKLTKARESEEALARERAEKDTLSKSIEDLDNNVKLAAERERDLSARAATAEENAEGLRGEVERLKKDNAKIPTVEAALDEERLLRKASEEARLAAERRARDTEAGTETLKARAEKLVLVEKELGEARQFFAGAIKRYEEKDAVLVSQNEVFKSERDEAVSREKETAARNADLQTEADVLGGARDRAESLSRDLETLRGEKESLNKDKQAAYERIRTLQAEMDLLRADNEKAKLLEDEMNADKQRIGTLESSLETLGGENERLKARLKQNQQDIQNLKENFQAFVEPLTQDFEERRK